MGSYVSKSMRICPLTGPAGSRQTTSSPQTAARERAFFVTIGLFGWWGRVRYAAEAQVICSAADLSLSPAARLITHAILITASERTSPLNPFYGIGFRRVVTIGWSLRVV